MGKIATAADCEGKAKFSSWTKAEHSAAVIAKREDTPMHVYPCGRCGGYHVGSSIIPKAKRHG
jgi:hypothetical protein